MVVDDAKAFAPTPGMMITPAPVGGVVQPSVPMSAGIFYPVMLAPCDGLRPDSPALWTATDTRELRVVVRGKTLCLSLRTRAAFAPLVDPYLAIIGAEQPKSPNANLVAELKKTRGGRPEVAGLPVVASECGRMDAMDFWIYDELTGTVSSPGPHRCLSIGSHAGKEGQGFPGGTPVVLAQCGELRAYGRDQTPVHERWTISAGAALLPTYRPLQPKDYFGGRAGLPITGPMGRCLSAAAGTNVVFTSDCDNRVEEDWFFAGDGLIRLGADGRCLARLQTRTVLLRPCDQSTDQGWVYDNPDPMPNGRWRNADVYARIHPAGQMDLCLAVGEDPFLDPVRQRNRVRVVPCASLNQRLVSWYVPNKVRTVRLALLRYADDDGSHPSNGDRSDEEIQSRMEGLALHLSEHYRGLGVRFVFVRSQDYLTLRDTFVNQVNSVNPDGSTNWTSGNRGSAVAATTFYGRATVITMAAYQGGGSSGGNAEFEIDRMRQLMTGKPETSYHNIPGLPRDKYGLPAVSMSLSEGFVNDSIGQVGHHAHEFGHYFGLGHTFDQDLFGDTPDDLPSGEPWLAFGSSPCGNPRTVTVKGRSFTPDRLNNEGYFGCQIGRTRNAFTPLQLGYMDWQIDHFLNRYPLVACQPIGSYDGDHVECENEESLARCRESAAYLKQHHDVDLDCRQGGRVSRGMADALKSSATGYLLDETEPGRSLVAKLSGSPQGAPRDPRGLGRVTAALTACTNLPLTMAVVTRLQEYQTAALQASPSLARAFSPGRTNLTPADRRALTAAATSSFKPGFIDNVPQLVP